MTTETLPAPTNAVTRYLRESRDLVNSLVLVAPLFVFYQVGILFTDGWKNGADFFTGFVFSLLGHDAILYALLNLAILVGFGVLWMRRRQEQTLSARTAGLVVAESTLWAMLVGGFVVQLLLSLGFEPPSAMLVPAGPMDTMGFFDTLVLSVGAGTYEELFFRAGMLTAMYYGFSKTKLGEGWLSAAAAIALSSLIFSAFHYPPIGMDPWELWSFVFRVVMGGFFAVLYWTRGFAVAVYTHAIYDIIVLLF